MSANAGRSGTNLGGQSSPLRDVHVSVNQPAILRRVHTRCAWKDSCGVGVLAKISHVDGYDVVAVVLASL